MENDYTVVLAGVLTDLVTDVKELQTLGWECLGGIVIVSAPIPYFYQAMVMRGDVVPSTTIRTRSKK